MTKLAEKGAKKGAEKKSTRHPVRLLVEVLMLAVYTGAAVTLSQYIVGWLMIWMVGSEAMQKPVMVGILSALTYLLSLATVLALPLKKRAKKHNTKNKEKKIWSWVNSDHKLLGLVDWPTWTDIGLAVAGFIVYAILASLILALFSLFPWFDAAEEQDIGFSLYLSGFDRVIAFLTTVVVAPIAEEIIFRGWLYGWLRNKIAAEYSNTVSMIISTLVVSVLFGLVHGQWNVGVNVFALSIVLCGFREITGTIYAGILLHMLKNGVAFWLLFMM